MLQTKPTTHAAYRMARDKNRLTQRLAAIKTAKPIEWANAPVTSRNARIERAERVATYRFAHLIYDNGAKTSCIIKDISKTGAKVMIEGNFTLPPKMILKIDASGFKKRVRIVWQDETIAGLLFLENSNPAPQSSGPVKATR